MSHNGAFITSAYVDSVRPTVLEVVAQEGLITTLQPAFHQLIKVLAARLDPAAGAVRLLTAFSDELFLVWNTSLQLHHLRLFSASFSENFYGLERLSEKRPSLRVSYLWLVLFPYLQRKLEQLFLRLREEEADGINSSTKLAAKVRRSFVCLYPHLHAFWTLADMAMLMAFSFRASSHHSLASYMVGYQLAYVSPERRRLQEERSAALLHGSKGLRHLLLSAAWPPPGPSALAWKWAASSCRWWTTGTHERIPRSRWPARGGYRPHPQHLTPLVAPLASVRCVGGPGGGPPWWPPRGWCTVTPVSRATCEQRPSVR